MKTGASTIPPASHAPTQLLARSLGTWELAAVAINGVVGSGIFGLPSRAFALAGAYSLVAFVACALLTLAIVFCFAEVASRFSASGGPYLYARVAFGPATGFLVGWLLWVSWVAAFAANCNLMMDYAALPALATGWWRHAGVILAVAALAALNIRGVGIAAKTAIRLLPVHLSGFSILSYNQRPLELGADIVVHSMTKYLGGHSDVVGGIAIVKDKSLYEQLAFLQNAVGAVPGPMDCFLVLRGLKTLHIRMERHAENAVTLADYLSKHPKVAKVMYPFNQSHPQVQVAKRQMRSGSGMISIIMKDGRDAAVRFAEATKIFTLAESLGGVESLIEVPAAMTHLSTAGSQLAVDPGLVRLSVGIEHKDDLLEDVEDALKGA